MHKSILYRHLWLIFFTWSKMSYTVYVYLFKLHVMHSFIISLQVLLVYIKIAIKIHDSNIKMQHIEWTSNVVLSPIFMSSLYLPPTKQLSWACLLQAARNGQHKSCNSNLYLCESSHRLFLSSVTWLAKSKVKSPPLYFII